MSLGSERKMHMHGVLACVKFVIFASSLYWLAKLVLVTAVLFHHDIKQLLR
jgi:hypothetical protein